VAPEEVVEALRRYVLRPGEEMARVAGASLDGMMLSTDQRTFEVSSPSWLVRRESWVDDAVVLRHDAQAHGTVYRYGFVWTRNGEALYLNSVPTMRALGRRLDGWSDPLAFAELLAELHYSVYEDGQETVYPFWDAHLIRDPRAFLDAYPSVDPALVSPPRVSREPSGVVIRFGSYYRYLLDQLTRGIDVLTWTVTASDGQPAEWRRDIVAERIEDEGIAESG
jgi:hypothetical protein